MVREIVFRGKSLHNGEWLYGFYTVSRITGDHAIEDKEGTKKVDPATVGQYTGLKDRNGRRIFEGDLIADGSKKMGMPAVIKYWEPDAAFRASRNGYSMLALDKDACRQNAIVVGNIYDNPELVK